jgi:hypothetical protein
VSTVLPLLARLRVPHLPALWLPLFLLWPLLAACFALLVPLALLWPAPRGRTLAALGESFRLLCALRGTQISVKNAESDFDVSFY